MASIDANLEQLIREEEQKTQEKYKPLANTPRHSLLSVLARVRAGGRYLTGSNIATLEREIFPDTATGEVLRDHWRDRVPPLDATFARGSVIFSGADGTAIPAGSLWKHPNGQLYALLEAGQILKGSYLGEVIAQELGSKGNLGADEELELTSSRILGLDSTATVRTIGGGVDSEGDDSYRTRIIAYERQGVRIGKVGDLLAWAVDSSPEVVQAWEFPNFDSSGAVLVQVISGSQLTSVAAVQNLQAVTDYLSRVAPMQLVDVRSPRILSVPMTIKILLAEDTVANRSAIEARLRQFWQAAAKPDSSYTEAQIRVVVETGMTQAQISLPSNPLLFSKFELPTQGAISWQTL